MLPDVINPLIGITFSCICLSNIQSWVVLQVVLMFPLYCTFQASLVGIVVPDPDVLPKFAKSKFGLSGSIAEIIENSVSITAVLMSTDRMMGNIVLFYPLFALLS